MTAAATAGMIEPEVKMDDTRDPRDNWAEAANGSQPDPIPSKPNSEQPPSHKLSAAAKQWLADNRAAIDAFNAWYEENGSPLDEYRSF